MKKQEIIEFGRKLYDKNLTFATSGNISLKTDEGIYVTASGAALGHLTSDDVSLIDFEGNLISGKKPSCEKMLHVEVYKQRSDVKAIIHTHPVNLTSFAVCHEPLKEPIMSENILYFEDIPVADYGMPSSIELVEKTIKHLNNRDVVIMASHWAMAIAENRLNAVYKG